MPEKKGYTHARACTSPRAPTPASKRTTRTNRQIFNAYCFFTAKLIRQNASMLRYSLFHIFKTVYLFMSTSAGLGCAYLVLTIGQVMCVCLFVCLFVKAVRFSSKKIDVTFNMKIHVVCHENKHDKNRLDL
jgi:hypothetical protein